jgi:membrane-associated protease RseP (regulator of RpoE activity)
MSPKHLWSGDWERESDLIAPSGAPTSSATVADESTRTREGKLPAGRSPRRGKRTSTLIVITVLVLAAAVWAIGSIAGSFTGSAKSTAKQRSTDIASSTSTSSSASSGVATGPATPTPKASPRVPPTSQSHADALGLELASAPGDRVTVKAVVPGSPANAVGIDAGDQLVTINGQHVTFSSQVDGILDKLPLGTLVTLQLIRGSAQITAQIEETGIP